MSVSVKVRGQGGQRLGLPLSAPQRHCDCLVKRSVPMGVARFKSEKAERVDHVRLLAPVPIQAQLVLVCLSAVPHA